MYVFEAWAVVDINESICVRVCCLYREEMIKDICSPGRILAKGGRRASSRPAEGGGIDSTLSPFSQPARLGRLLLPEDPSKPGEVASSIFCSKGCRLKCPDHVSLQDLSKLCWDVYDNKEIKSKSARQEKLRTLIREARSDGSAGSPHQD